MARVADAFDEIESAGVRLGLGLRTHPAQDPFRIGEEGEDGGGRSDDMGFAPDHERCSHRFLLPRGGRAPPERGHA